MKIRIHRNTYHKIIFGFLVLSFLFDFIDKIEIFYGINFIKFNRYLKLVFAALSMLFLISKLKHNFRELKIILFLIATLFVVFLLKNNYTSLYIDEFLRYLFGLLIYPLCYYTYYKSEILLTPQLYTFFKLLIVINAISILIGLVFNLHVIQTYQYGRFGYNGILLSQGFTPYVYLCATALFLIFKDKNMFALTLLLAIISGVKGVYFSQFLIITLYILYNKKYTSKNKVIFICITFIGFIGLLATLFLSPIFKDVLTNDGYLSMIFSYRNEHLLQTINELNELNYNALIGVINLEIVRIETQLFDILLFLGIIGLIVYGFFIRHLFVKIGSTKTPKIYLLVALTLSLLSGNLFYIPMAMILLFLILFALENNLPNSVKH